jgi:tetratricopeptide (TPR) repeat protein
MKGLAGLNRRAVVAGAACALGAGLALVIWVGGRAPAPPIPAFDTSHASPQVASAIGAACQQLRKDPGSGVKWGRLGMLAMAHQYRREARDSFAAAARLLPRQFSWPYYAGILDEETDLTAAVAQYDAALRLSPRYLPLRCRLARVLMRLNRFDEAESELQAAARLDPESPFPKIGLGRLEMARGNPEAARSHFAEAVAVAVWSRDAHLELAQALQRVGEVSHAFREQQEAARLPAVSGEMPDPILQEVEDLELTGRQLSKRADAAIGRGDLAEAADLLREVIRQRPDLSRPQLNLGQILQAQGNLPAAIDVFRDTIEKFPGEPLAHFSLGTALEMTGQLAQALDAYHQAARLKPDYADAHYCLGLLLRKQKDNPGAVEALRRAVSANPGFAPVHLALGSLLADLGDRSGAIEEVRLAAKLAPQDSEAKLQLQRLLGESASNETTTQ